MDAITLSRPNHLPTSKPQPPSTLTASLHQHSICQCHPADAFLNAVNTPSLDSTLLVISPDQLVLSSPLISIGPNTDADSITLVLEMNYFLALHSSCWEVVLRAKPWNLTYEQASNLSRVLLADIKGTPEFHVMLVPNPQHFAENPWYCSPVRIQPKAQPHIKVILSENAHAALKLNQHEKVERFKKDLDNVWQSLDKVMKTLASRHHKSVQHVQNDLHLGCVKLHSKRSKINTWNAFCWKKGLAANRSNENVAGGKSTLLNLVEENHIEYHRLSAEDKDHLVEEFSGFRELKSIGICITMESWTIMLQHVQSFHTGTWKCNMIFEVSKFVHKEDTRHCSSMLSCHALTW
ncbi:hypothetical protein EDC04DRAFT_2616121 [Pisolithus marmoratus]|nr:hypothetical protein EDC04DRAFT_2616121 [Pisolithus marmoratus]